MNIGSTFSSDVDRAVHDDREVLSDAELREPALKQERSIRLCVQSAPVVQQGRPNRIGQLTGFGEV